MRKLFTFLFAVILTAGVFAQAPQKMSYQAVIRNAGNTLITSHAVGMRISILQGTTPVYIETQTPTTNANGLISIEVGSGTVVSGSFTAINWRTGTYSIKTETDPTGGTNYTSIVGTSQLLSVPYALNSKTADSLTGAQGIKLNGIAAGAEVNVNPDWNATSGDGMILNKPAIPAATVISAGTNVTVTGTGTTASPYVINATGGSENFTHYIGELYGGGIVVSVWKESGIEHGLITSLVNLGYKTWTTASCYTLTVTGGATSSTDGLANSIAIVAQAGASTTYAAYVCRVYSATGDGGLHDWYLPAGWELAQCFNAGFVVNTILGATNGFLPGYYWSSTEGSTNNAFCQNLGFDGGVLSSTKSGSARVRAVRRF